MKIHPVLFYPLSLLFYSLPVSENPNRSASPTRLKDTPQNLTPLAIIYHTDTGFVHIETTEVTWAKQVRFQPGSVAVLLVDLDRSKSEPDADIARIHPLSVSVRIVCKGRMENRTGSLGVPATVGLGTNIGGEY